MVLKGRIQEYEAAPDVYERRLVIDFSELTDTVGERGITSAASDAGLIAPNERPYQHVVYALNQMFTGQQLDDDGRVWAYELGQKSAAGTLEFRDDWLDDIERLVQRYLGERFVAVTPRSGLDELLAGTREDRAPEAGSLPEVCAGVLYVAGPTPGYRLAVTARIGEDTDPLRAYFGPKWFSQSDPRLGIETTMYHLGPEEPRLGTLQNVLSRAFGGTPHVFGTLYSDSEDLARDSRIAFRLPVRE